jgi:poly(hydroxyalkanoate) depolymerase family esterase
VYTSTSPGAPPPAERSRAGTVRAATAVGAVLAVIGALVYVLTGATPALANTSTLTQVSSFGSNPGALQMYDYVPTTAAADAPLVVALHGCTQNATDYYDDSGWPQFADEWGFDLVFPQQTSSNNIEDCFDWYTPSDDSRGDGEAESIIQMVDYMEANHSINPSRIYITGLSAGAGMTADMLADYPDVFASGSIDSGLPAQCATSLTGATTCEDGAVNNTVAQWTALAKNSDPGYSGPWPTVQIWQGTADAVVSYDNFSELMDQWTGVQGVSQTASSTASLTGGTTESIYDNSSGEPVVETFSISGMGHGLAVEPGSGSTDCGATGAYFLNYICSSYYTAVYWGLNSTSTSSPSASSSPTATSTPTPSTSPSQSASPTGGSTPLACVTATNYQQTVDGNAYESLGDALAEGSNQNMGLDNVAITTSLEETSPGYWVIVSSC